MVYVLSKNGQPIMPTQNHAKVRLLLKSGKAEFLSLSRDSALAEQGYLSP